MNRDEKRKYNRLYRIANKDRIEAKRAERKAGLGDNVRRCGVPGCDGIYDTAGYCARHYAAWRRNGDTELRQEQIHGKTVAERVAAYTKRARWCWEWIGTRNPQGYGVLRVGENTRLAHRVAWELVHGPIPDGLDVCHKCDNRGCVRLDHLFLGTIADNNADMRDKGRQYAKLTVADVRSIRASRSSSAELAARFGIHEAHVRKVRSRRTWGYVS